MSRDYPDLIDPWRAADGRRSFTGTIPLSRMKRLRELLDDDSGEATFTASFGYDRQRNVVIDVSVQAGLRLVCQSSLEPYTEEVRRKSKLVVISDLTEEESVAAHYEPVLVTNHRLAIMEVVEDELLLGVPDVPRNPALEKIEFSTEGGEASASRVEDEPTQRPFEGLADLMKSRADN